MKEKEEGEGRIRVQQVNQVSFGVGFAELFSSITEMTTVRFFTARIRSLDLRYYIGLGETNESFHSIEGTHLNLSALLIEQL